MTNAGTGTGTAHLVYVRRKQDADLARSAALHSSQPGKTIHQDEATHSKSSHLKESSSQVSPIPKHPPSLGLLSARPTALLPSPGNSTSVLSPANLDHLHANPMLSTPTKLNAKHWEERSCKLSHSLKKLDQSDQRDYIEMLRSLSSVELSKHAVELEKRSIQLSLEEVKELQRVQVLDVLEIYSTPEHPRTNSTCNQAKHPAAFYRCYQCKCFRRIVKFGMKRVSDGPFCLISAIW